MKIIFTAQETSLRAAQGEWSRAHSGATTRALATDVGLAEVPCEWREAARTARDYPLIFTRHIFPGQIELPPGSDPLEAVQAIAQRLDPGRSYSVQARAAGGKLFTRALSEALQEQGFTLDIRNPQQAVSVYSAPEAVYIGVSDAGDNLSNWNGGMMHFSAQGLISRAECKLLEALSVFDIPIKPGAVALDLGAAPGGWSNALAGRGARVTAVDPAQLDARVLELPGVRHVPLTAQAFLQQDGETYDLIVNDMKMDAHMALDLLLGARDRLAPGGAVISTLKLPKHEPVRTANACVKRVREGAELLGARQLFHNRSEITVCFR